MKKPRETASIVALSLLGLLIMGACSSKEKAPPPRVVPVSIATVVQKEVPVQLRAIGNVEAYSVVSVKSRIAGTIAKVHFKEGHDVRKGDLIFTIDPRTFEAALKQAEANLARDAALLRNAQEDLRRYTALSEKGYVTMEQFDQIRANAAALEATVNADKAQVENSRLQLEYCFIRSPIDGRTGSIIVNAGNVVKENDTMLVVINQISPIYVTFSVPEKHLSEIKKHMAAGKLTVAAFTSKDDKHPEQGTLTFIENAVDTATGTIKLKGTFENKERRLWPGQFVDAVLTLATQAGAMVIPSQALQTGQEGQFVFVVKSDMTVESRPVTVSRALDGETVIEKGLKADERVVTDGQLRLVPGAKVSVKSP